MIDPVLGTLLGAVTGAGLSYATQAALWKRQDRRRFDEALRLASIRIVETLDDLDTFALQRKYDMTGTTRETIDTYSGAIRVLKASLLDLRIAGGEPFDEVARLIDDAGQELMLSALGEDHAEHKPLSETRPQVEA